MNREIKFIVNSLLVVVLLLICVSGMYQFGKNLDTAIQHKKEVDSLAMEKLRLEIELKKLEFQEKTKTKLFTQ